MPRLLRTDGASGGGGCDLLFNNASPVHASQQLATPAGRRMTKAAVPIINIINCSGRVTEERKK